MKNFTRFLWMIALGALSSCMMESQENPGDIPGPVTGTDKVGSLTLTVPGRFAMMNTRALTEQEEVDIDDLFLLVFNPDGSFDQIKQVNLTNDLKPKTSTADINDYELTATLPTGPHNFVLLANVGAIITANGGVSGITALAAAGKTYSALTTLLTGSATGKLLTAASSAVPMWGESGSKDPAANAISVDLIRALAKIDVGVGAFDSATDTWTGKEGTVAAPTTPILFTVSAVYVVKSSDKFQLIPTSGTYDPINKKVTAPSVPGIGQIAVDDAFEYTGTRMLREIYVPEATIVGTAPSARMAIVIKGEYTGASGNGQPTYYRVDFSDGTDLKNVLRNTNYRFDISRVVGNGQSSVANAYNSTSSNIEVNVVEWDDEPMGNGVFVGDKYIKMSEATPIDMSAIAGSVKTVKITTNFDNFTLDIGSPGTVEMRVANGVVSDGGYAPGGAFSYALAVAPVGEQPSDGVLYNLTITTAASSLGAVHNWTIDATDIATLPFSVRQTPAATLYNVQTSATNGSAVANHSAAAAGTPIEISATPSAGYVFASWNIPGVTYTGGSSSSTPVAKFNMPSANVSATASFTRQYTITVNNPASGGSATSNYSQAASGTTVEISAGPASGYWFTRWNFGSTPTFASGYSAFTNPTRITMPAADLTVAPRFQSLTADVLVPAYGSAGATYWAAANSIPQLGGTATFQLTPFLYDGQNQYTWAEVTGGVSGATAPGVCPSGYRLPTVHETWALMKSNATAFTLNAYYNNVSDPTPTEAEYASGVNPYYNNGRHTDASGWNTSAQTGIVAGQIFVMPDGGTLFFPASGLSGGANNQGTSGYFWSSSELSTSLAFDLGFVASNVGPADVDGKSNRFSVRCVRSLQEFAGLAPEGRPASPRSVNRRGGISPQRLEMPPVGGKKIFFRL